MALPSFPLNVKNFALTTVQVKAIIRHATNSILYIVDMAGWRKVGRSSCIVNLQSAATQGCVRNDTY